MNRREAIQAALHIVTVADEMEKGDEAYDNHLWHLDLLGGVTRQLLAHALDKNVPAQSTMEVLAAERAARVREAQ